MPAPQHAHAKGPEDFVAREGEEVAAELSDVDGDVRYGLRTVNHQVRPVLVRELRHTGDGIGDAQDIGDVGGGNDLGLGTDLCLHLLVGDEAALVAVHVDELCANLLADLLPGDEVAVMLHDGDADLVAFLEHAWREGLRDDVEGLGGVAIEDDVAGVFLAGADEARRAPTGGVNGLGRLDGELVQTT